jgi:hypothetical protein
VTADGAPFPTCTNACLSRLQLHPLRLVDDAAELEQAAARHLDKRPYRTNGA